MFTFKPINKKLIEKVLNESLKKNENYSSDLLDKIKLFGFYFSKISGFSFGFEDLKVNTQKNKLFFTSQNRINNLFNQWQQGFISNDMNAKITIKVWQKAFAKLRNYLKYYFKSLNEFNHLYLII